MKGKVQEMVKDKSVMFACIGVNVHASSNRNMKTRMVSYYLTADKAKPVGDAQSSVQQHEAVTKDFPRLVPRKGLFCVLGVETQTCSAERKNNGNKSPSIPKILQK